ncbi:EPSP synthase family protein, partial [Chlamydia psittaci C1/97]
MQEVRELFFVSLQHLPRFF